jgi:hypothetical protein
LESGGERSLIQIIQFSAEGNPLRKASDFHLTRRQGIGKIMRGCLPFHRVIGGDNNFMAVFLLRPCE